ncbi:MAG: hypothetical protein ACK5FV_04070, partial [Bacteroidota bacterium]
MQYKQKHTEFGQMAGTGVNHEIEVNLSNWNNSSGEKAPGCLLYRQDTTGMAEAGGDLFQNCVELNSESVVS